MNGEKGQDIDKGVDLEAQHTRSKIFTVTKVKFSDSKFTKSKLL